MEIQTQRLSTGQGKEGQISRECGKGCSGLVGRKSIVIALAASSGSMAAGQDRALLAEEVEWQLGRR